MVLFFGHRKRFEAMAVSSDDLENEILGFLLFTDGFSTLEIFSVTFTSFFEKALRRARFISESMESHRVKFATEMWQETQLP
jgi:hypothetical protein